MFIIYNTSYGDPAYTIKNAYIILLIHFIDIKLCIFNHSYVHPPEVVNLRWRLQKTHALYLALICTSISITNINTAHISNKGQIYNDGALSCCCTHKGLYGVNNLKFTNMSPLIITSNKYMPQYINCRSN